jgi:hypothetical protein
MKETLSKLIYQVIYSQAKGILNKSKPKITEEDFRVIQ